MTPPCRGRLRLIIKQGLYGSPICLSSLPMSSSYVVPKHLGGQTQNSQG
jgi:hypothetical protein